MPLQINLNVPPQWETIEDGGESIKLLMQRMPRVLQRRAVAGRDRKDWADTVQMVLDNVVKDWADVVDDNGKPIPFSAAGLDILLGVISKTLAEQVELRALRVGGLYEDSETDPTNAHPKQTVNSPDAS